MPTGVLVAWVRSSCLILKELSWKEVAFPDWFAESRTVFITKTSYIDDNGRIIRSPDDLRPLTLCNSDCKLLTSALCRGLIWYNIRCTHPSQRCIYSRPMTDNIFEIETTALAHVACAPQESGVLLSDFAAAYPSVNHSWIFSVIENTGLAAFLCRFLRSIERDSITQRGVCREQNEDDFLMARGVRQGCPASGFLFYNGLRYDLQMAPRINDPKEPPTTWNSCSLHNALTLTISPLLHHLAEG